MNSTGAPRGPWAALGEGQENCPAVPEGSSKDDLDLSKSLQEGKEGSVRCRQCKEGAACGAGRAHTPSQPQARALHRVTGDTAAAQD